MMVRNPTGPVLCFAVALVVLAACGQSEEKTGKVTAADGQGGAAKPAAAAAIDPCALLTKADAAAVLGEAVTDARKKTVVGFAPGHSCAYFSAAPMEEAGAVWSVKVTVYDAATFKAEDSYFASPTVFFNRTRKAQMDVKSKNPPRDIAGVGDAAFWQPVPGVLNILDRGVYLAVSVHANFHIPPGTSDEVHAAEEAAGLKAATGLAQKTLLPRLETL